MSSDFSVLSLEDLTDGSAITYGVVKPGEECANGIRFIRGGDIAAGRVLDAQLRTITPEVSEQYSRTLLRGGELLVSLVGNPGEVAIAPDSLKGANIARQVGLIRIDQTKADTNYVQYFLRSRIGRDLLLAHSKGSVQQVINLKDLKSVKVPLPSIQIQRSVAGFMQSLDDRITLLRETNVTLEAIAQALFKSWFVDFDPVRAKMEGRAPEGMDEATAALFPDSFEESELGLVPMGWRVGSFSDVCDISSGKRPLDRSDLVSDLYPIPLYGGAGIMGYTSIPLFDDLKILTGRVGTLGKVHIAYPPFWASDNVLVVTPKDQSCFSVVLHWLRSIDVLALNRGSTQPLLTQRDLGAQRGVIPPSHVVAEFEEVVELLYQRIQEQEVQVQTLASLRDTLLPRLISGQVRLSEI